MDKDTSINHQSLVDPDSICGPKVIEVMLKEPEYLFLNRYYFLLYNSIMPNCIITLAILRKYYDITSNVENYIITGDSARIRNQRLLNFLLFNLKAEKNYMKFYSVINSISVTMCLPHSMVADYHSKDESIYHNFKEEHLFCDNGTHDWVHDIDGQGAPGAVHISRKRRKLSELNCKKKLQISDKGDNDKITVVKLSSIQESMTLSDKLLITSSVDALCLQNILTYDEVVNICLGHIQSKKNFLDDKLEILVSELKFSTATSDTDIVQTVNASEYQLPKSIEFPDFGLLKSNYEKILKCLPKDIHQSVQKLEDKLSAAQMCSIIECSIPHIANKMILDCLIEKMNCKEDLLDLCDQLDRLSDISPDLKQLINKLRIELFSMFGSASTSTSYNYSTSAATTDLSLCTNGAKLPTVDPQEDPTSPLPSSENVKTSLAATQHLIEDISTESNSHPELADLYRYVVPKYAIHWEDLGMKLGLKDHHINNISQNNAYNPNRIVDCCKSMLKKWLENDCSATWDKLKIAIGAINTAIGTMSKQGLQPPALPPNFIDRPELLKEIATKVLKSSVNPNTYGTTVTITGAGGFGKTLIVTKLCHHPDIKKQFTDGFVFFVLGPQTTDPSVKLSKAYHLLTGKDLKEGDIDFAQQEIKKLTNTYFQNLLVVIDDVWSYEAAKPLVKAFSNCKIILTTRKNDFEQYIPCNELVTVNEMRESEAFSLLTSGIVDSHQLSKQDKGLLSKLAQSVYWWPLLLSLIRGHLSHNMKYWGYSYREAIQNVQTKLKDNGLTAFDNKNSDREKCREDAVKVCIDLSLQLLTESELHNLKSLIIWAGIGTSLPKAVLNILLGSSKEEAEKTVYQLWAYGLVQYSNITMSFGNHVQCHVEVHAVICEYIFKTIDIEEAKKLSKVESAPSLSDELSKTFKQSYAKDNDLSSLTHVDYLKFVLSKIENVVLPYFVKTIIMCTFSNPCDVKRYLSYLQRYISLISKHHIKFLRLTDEVQSLISECEQTIKNIHELYRKINQRNLYEKNYDMLIQNVQDYIRNYPLHHVALKAVTIVNKIKPYCKGELQKCILVLYEVFQTETHDYHGLTTLTLPYIKFHIKVHKNITKSIETGLPKDVKVMCDYMHRNFNEEYEFVRSNHLIKMQEVAPNQTRHMALNW